MNESYKPESDPYLDAAEELEAINELKDKITSARNEIQMALILESFKGSGVNIDIHFGDWLQKYLSLYEAAFNNLISENKNIPEEWMDEDNHQRIIGMVKERMSGENIDKKKYPKLVA